MAEKKPKPIKNGIHLDMHEDIYHGDPHSISKSGLWSMLSKTPAHHKYAPPRENVPHLDFGKAVHLAVLEPERAGTDLIQGPPDRRGNRWKDALGEAMEQKGAILLTEANYEEVMLIQDQAHKHPIIKKLADANDSLFEASAFWKDERTGLQFRCRPDQYTKKLKIIADLKTSADASAWNWARTAGNLGYHVQEGMYTDGWQAAGGGDVEGFIFIVIESKAPFCTAVYEFIPSAVTEGRACMNKAMDLYAECLKTGIWPGYSEKIQQLDIPRFSYRETDAPDAMRG